MITVSRTAQQLRGRGECMHKLKYFQYYYGSTNLPGTMSLLNCKIHLHTSSNDTDTGQLECYKIKLFRNFNHSQIS